MSDSCLNNISLTKNSINGRVENVFSSPGINNTINLLEYATIFSNFHLINTLDYHILLPIIRLFDNIKQLCSKQFTITKLNELEDEIYETLSLNEGSFPVSECTFLMHEIAHLCHFIRMLGPVRTFWMFSFERFNFFLKNLIHNNTHPHVNLMKNYLVFNYYYSINNNRFVRKVNFVI